MDDLEADDTSVEAEGELDSMEDEIGWDVGVAAEPPTTVREVPTPRSKKLLAFEQQPWYTKF